MKIRTLLFSLLVLGAVAVHAADLVITNYFSGYVYVPNTFTNAGDTGLSTGTPYCCFTLASISGLSSNQAASSTNGDVRPLLTYFINSADVALAANTNRPSTVDIRRSSNYRISGTNTYEITVYNVEVQRLIGAAAFVSE